MVFSTVWFKSQVSSLVLSLNSVETIHSKMDRNTTCLSQKGFNEAQVNRLPTDDFFHSNCAVFIALSREPSQLVQRYGIVSENYCKILQPQGTTKRF